MAKKRRPKRLEGQTIRAITGCGKLYITVNNDSKGEPVEVFAVLGKSGSCQRSSCEAIARAITVGLKYGVPISEYSRHLFGIQCDNPHPFPREEKTLSCADAIARILKEVNGEQEKG